MDTAVSNLQRHHPGASFMVFNFKEGDEPSLLSDILSRHDMTVVDYPRHYEGYPILPLEMINYFLRSSDSWLSLEGQRNVILMHCERGGWPALAFMLAGLLLYSKKQVGEMKTLDLVLRNAPKELWTPLSLMNPRPSELRYLKYISERSLTSDWPPCDAALVIESVVLMDVPLFDGGKGCRPVVHVYCQDPSMKSNTRPRLLCSSLMSEDGTHYCKKEECQRVKINLECRVQGDVFIECIHLGDDLVSEEKIFKVMFHTAFVQSYTMLLGPSEVDVLSNANCKIPNDFKVEVLFHNPEKVQLSIAKEMASLESGHESESEFFEAEEFDITVSQDHNRDNLMSREIVSYDFTLEGTNLDHHSENKKEELDFSSFKSIPAEDGIGSLEMQSSFDNKEQIQQSIEVIVSRDRQEELDLSSFRSTAAEDDIQSLKAQSSFDNKAQNQQSIEVIVSQDRQEELDLSSFKSFAAEDDIQSLEAQSSFDNKAQNQQSIETIVSQEKNSEQVSEVEYVPIHDPSNERDSYQAKEIDFHPSVKGNYILYDDESNVGNESVMEVTVSKIQDANQSVFSVSSNGEEFDSIQVDSQKSSGVENASVLVDVVEQSQEVGSEIASSFIAYEASKDIVELEETTKDGSTSASLESTMELINNAMKSIVLLDKNQEDSSEAPDLSVDTELRETEDSSQASPLEARLEPNIVVEGSECKPAIVSKSNSILQEVVVNETPISSENVILLGGSQEITHESSPEAGLELNVAEKGFLAVQESHENSPRTGSNFNFEVEEGSEHDCSEISSSEIEYENCIMSKSFTSIEGSEDSSEAACSHAGSEPFLVAQATSSEPNNATKHIVVVVEDSNEHEVKVQVQPRGAAVDGGSRGVQQKAKSKRKPMGLADAVAKVTMQKRVISMWVPRDKQLTPDDAKHRASVYKWVPKESGSTSEEASKQSN
ncbi:hypothetical protein V2J09_014144 [Rumex salicifolius]